MSTTPQIIVEEVEPDAAPIITGTLEEIEAKRTEYLQTRELNEIKTPFAKAVWLTTRSDSTAYYGNEFFMYRADGWQRVEEELNRLYTIQFSQSWKTANVVDMARTLASVNREDCEKYTFFKLRNGLPLIQAFNENQWDWQSLGRWSGLYVPHTATALLDGVYDCATKEFIPHKPGSVFGPIVRTSFDRDLLEKLKAGDFTDVPPKFGELLKWLDFALGKDADSVRYFREVLAEILRPQIPPQFITAITGPSGGRKTTLLTALLILACGQSALSMANDKQLTGNQFSTSVLLGKMANLSNDSSPDAKFGDTMKQLTQAHITVEKKGRDPVTVRQTAKLFTTLNRPHPLNETSEAVKNRLHTFHFEARNDNRRNSEGTRWTDETYYTPEDRKWCAHWLLAGLDAKFEDGREREIKPSARALAAKQQFLADADPVERFVTTHVRPKAGWTPTNKILDAAIECGCCEADERARAAFKRSFGQYMKDRHGLNAKSIRVDGQVAWCHNVELLASEVEAAA